MTVNLFSWSAAVLGHPVEQRPLGKHANALLSERQSSAAPVEQKPLGKHANALLSERGSPRPPPSNRSLWDEHSNVLDPCACALRQKSYVYPILRLMFDGGGRGRPRSDRRARVFP